MAQLETTVYCRWAWDLRHISVSRRTLHSPIYSWSFHLDFFAGSPAKLLSNSTWNPGEIQMDHVEHVDSTHSTYLTQIFQWTPPGLHLDSTWTGGHYTPP
jgi:hypothetical protein